MEIEGLDKGLLAGGQLIEEADQPGPADAAGRRVDDRALLDLIKVAQQSCGIPVVNVAQLPLEQSNQQQGQHAVQRVDLDLLVSPMPHGLPGDGIGAVQASEGRFDLSLSVGGGDDLLRAPAGLIGHPDAAAKQMGRQLVQGLLVAHHRQREMAILILEVNRQQAWQVLFGEQPLNLTLHALARGLAAPRPLAVACQAFLERGQTSLRLGQMLLHPAQAAPRPARDCRS